MEAGRGRKVDHGKAHLVVVSILIRRIQPIVRIGLVQELDAARTGHVYGIRRLDNRVFLHCLRIFTSRK